jgi:hypothetical protein
VRLHCRIGPTEVRRAFGKIIKKGSPRPCRAAQFCTCAPDALRAKGVQYCGPVRGRKR